jgi:hypothetical protein
MKDFCELRKKDDGKIVRRAEKSGKLFCNYRRSSGIIFLSNLQKVIEMCIFQKHHLLENNSRNDIEKKRKIEGEG